MAIENVNEIAPNAEDWEIIKELNLLNNNTEILYRNFNLLSGEEQVKILLISLFFKGYNFLLIDEPTNLLRNIDRNDKLKLISLTNNKNPLVWRNNLQIKYNDKTIFNPISFEVNNGDRVAIIGKKGIGKSSILGEKIQLIIE